MTSDDNEIARRLGHMLDNIDAAMKSVKVALPELRPVIVKLLERYKKA